MDSSAEYTDIIFHDNSSKRVRVSLASSNVAWYVGADTGSSVDGQSVYAGMPWSPEQRTYYLYDYRDIFGGAAKCYAWGGGCENASFPGAAMTKVTNSSGQMYSITLDELYSGAKLGLTAEITTGDLSLSGYSGYCYSFWNSGDGGNSWGDLETAKAHDWVYNTMRLRQHAHNVEEEDSGACKSEGVGAQGYYAKAKEAYESFNNSIRTKIAALGEGYNHAYARFQAWAEACEETATINVSAGVYTLNVETREAKMVLKPLTEEGLGTPLILAIVVSSIAFISIGGYFAIRHRKHE